MSGVIEIQKDYKWLYEVTLANYEKQVDAYCVLAKTASTSIEQLKKERDALAKTVAQYEKQINLF